MKLFLLLLSINIFYVSSLPIDNILDEGNIDNILDNNNLLELNDTVKNKNYDLILNYLDSIRNTIQEDYNKLQKNIVLSKDEKDRKESNLKILQDSVENISKKLTNLKYEYSNLTSKVDISENDKQLLLDSIKTQSQVIDKQIEGLSVLYQEAHKFKNYKEHSLIIKTIDSLKKSIIKKSEELKNHYQRLLKSLELDIKNNRNKMVNINDEYNLLNKTFLNDNKMYENMVNEYKNFIDKYNTELTRNRDISNSFEKDIELINNIHKFLKNYDPTQLYTCNKKLENLQKKCKI